MEEARAGPQAVHFMRGIMDEFTHIANYTAPVDGSSVVVVAARRDAYVPRDGCAPLNQLWPGCEIRYVPTGHVAAYLLHHRLFRLAVNDAMNKLLAAKRTSTTAAIYQSNT